MESSAMDVDSEGGAKATERRNGTFVVEVCEGSARVGQLRRCGAVHETPCAVWATRAGQPNTVTADLLQEIAREEKDRSGRGQWLSLQYGEFMGIVEELSNQRMTLGEFVGSAVASEGKRENESSLLLTSVDAWSAEVHPINANAVNVRTANGRFKVSPEEFASAVAVLRPSIAVVPQARSSANAAKKRSRKCVDYGLAYLKSSLSALDRELSMWGSSPPLSSSALVTNASESSSESDANASAAAPETEINAQQENVTMGDTFELQSSAATLSTAVTSSQSLSDASRVPPLIWTVVSGGLGTIERKFYLRDLRLFMEERKASAAHAISLDGFLLTDYGTGEEQSTRDEAVAQTIAELPEELPRVMQGVDDPVSILRAVAQGVDGFLCTSAFILAEEGKAIMLDLPGDSLEKSAGADPLYAAVIHMEDKCFVQDWAPVAPASRCECFGCRAHTRAYINHLLLTKELLGLVLLTLHNMHQYARFFTRIRQLVKKQELAAYAERFEAAWKGWSGSLQSEYGAPREDLTVGKGVTKKQRKDRAKLAKEEKKVKRLPVEKEVPAKRTAPARSDRAKRKSDS